MLVVHASPGLKSASGQNVTVLPSSNPLKTPSHTPPSCCFFFLLSLSSRHLDLILGVLFYLSHAKFSQRKLLQASLLINSQCMDKAEKGCLEKGWRGERQIWLGRFDPSRFFHLRFTNGFSTNLTTWRLTCACFLKAFYKIILWTSPVLRAKTIRRGNKTFFSQL